MGDWDRKLVAERSDLFLWMKVKEWFWSRLSVIIYACFLTNVTWPFLRGRFFPFLVPVTWHFHLWNLLPFSVGLHKTYFYLVFQIHFFRKRHNIQMEAVMLQLNPSFYTKYSKKSPFISANTYEKLIVSKEYCIAR